MRDRTVGDTFYMFFTTRAFASGVPTVLAGTPVVSAYEDASITQITAGITLGVDHDSVVGLNLLTIVATGANGYETGKDYSMVITTGTVGGVSVVGEVVGEFSLDLAAALKAVDALNDVAATDIVSAGAITTSSGAVSTVTTCTTTTTNTDMRGTDSAATATNLATVDTNVDSILVDTAEIGTAGAGLTNINLPNQTMDITGNLSGSVGSVTGGATSAAQTTAQNDLDIITGASGVNLLTATQASIDAIEVDTNSLNDTKIPNTLNTTASGNIGVDWANVENPTTALDLSGTDIQLVDTATTVTGGATSAAQTTAQNDLDIITGASGVNLLTATQASIDAIETDTGTTLPATLGTPAADVSADIAAVKVDTAATLVDTVILTSVFKVGAAVAGTLSTTQMSTNLTEATDDHYNGRLITWTSGVLLEQQTDITDYTGATKVLTFTTTTDAPSSTDTFVIT
tara:strand:- start:2822 stop:4198 length:1377 start_codon:yes stop_codon:yes gene_type:complete